MSILNYLLHQLPIKIANSIVAHLVLKIKIKAVDGYFIDCKLRYSKFIKMDLSKFDIGHQYLAFTGVYENELSQKIVALKKVKCGLMVDVGSNYGYFSLLWCGNEPRNTCFSFEASPKNFVAISNNINKNNLSGQITLETTAVSDVIGQIYFDQGPEDQTGWGGIVKEKKDADLIEIETTTLDAYFANRDINIEVLKIDTEGADYLVIKGAINLLKKKKIAHIFWEENMLRAKQLGLNGWEAKVLFNELGYEINQIGDNEYHAFLGKHN